MPQSFSALPTNDTVNPYNRNSRLRGARFYLNYVSIHRQRIIFGVVLFMGALFFFFGSPEEERPFTGSRGHETAGVKEQEDDECQKVCHDQAHTTTKDQKYFGIDLLNMDQMNSTLHSQRKALQDHLKSHEAYGEQLYLQLFEPLVRIFHPKTKVTTRQRHSVGRHKVFKSPTLLVTERAGNVGDGHETVGWKGLIRKLEGKILEVQLNILKERETICRAQCLATTDKDTSQAGPSPAKYHSQFVWATGGDGVAAGDGNLVGESYTDILGSALQPIFASLGISFKANNHAMRHMQSGSSPGEEYALCVQSIFGHHVDVAAFDFAGTAADSSSTNTASDDWKVLAYAYRLAQISQAPHDYLNDKNAPVQHEALRYSKPALFLLHQSTSQTKLLQSLEDLGMAILAWDEVWEQKILQEFPDMLGREQVDEIPGLAQYMRCANDIEGGEPGCREHKFNTTVCPGRGGMSDGATTGGISNNHNRGYKYHALMGYILSFVLLDLLEEAIKDLKSRTPANKVESPEEMRVRLTKKLKSVHDIEQEHYNNIFGAEFLWPGGSIQANNGGDTAGAAAASPILEELQALVTSPALCHTALLPSDIRMRGVLTENMSKVTEDIRDTSGYEQAIMFDSILEKEHHRPGEVNPNPSVYLDPRNENPDQLTLVGSDQERSDCPMARHLDYRDSFFVSSIEGKRSLTIPNDRELDHYSEYDPRNSLGWIIACVTRCLDSECPYNDLFYRVGSKAYLAGNPRNISQATMDEIGHLELQVDGVAVEELLPMSGSCYSLQNADGHVWIPNQNGKYEISARIVDASSWSYIRFSSFILL